MPEPDQIPLRGHLWTILPQIIGPRRAPDLATARRWSTQVVDPRTGVLELEGLLDPLESDTVVVVVHGLAGTAQYPYMYRAVAAAQSLGWASLRLNLRGAERSGRDYYHAGLHSDLHAALASPQLADYRRIFLFGYSLGGHLCMHVALEPDERVAGVAAICSPLDLSRSVTQLDRPASFIYRRYVLTSAKEMYCQPGATHPMPTPRERVRRVRTWREFDELTIAPRWGFESAEDYYQKTSVGPLLGRLEVPTLLVHSRQDPMVPPWTWQHMVEGANDRLILRALDTGGHVAFPREARLGIAPEATDVEGLEAQVMHWFDRLAP